MNLVFYFLAINALTFFLYWQDKRAARRGGVMRTPEYVLLLAGFMGGTLAAIVAQQRLRHKTRKASFQIKFWLLTVIQVMLLVVQPGPLRAILSRLAA
jgi:uncharacterized membrane protein YsdA (DUF1294 family)